MEQATVDDRSGRDREGREIGARSAPAKGRVERLWGTLEDRLVSELRLAGITSIEAANASLPVFLERHNARFAVPAADPTPAWRPWPAGLGAASVFCFHYPRRVGRDNTVSWPGGGLARPRRADGRSWFSARCSRWRQGQRSLTIRLHHLWTGTSNRRTARQRSRGPRLALALGAVAAFVTA